MVEGVTDKNKKMYYASGDLKKAEKIKEGTLSGKEYTNTR